MKNVNPRSEAQKYAIGAIVTAIVVLLIFFALSKAGIGNAAATPDPGSSAAPIATSSP